MEGTAPCISSENSSIELIFDNFCSMVVEEYLARKNLTNTLETFREEWQRPSEEQAVVSWFEVALKLRLPELITQNSKDRTILENVVQALVRESSVRCRQSPEVILTGLAAMPKSTTLPHIVDHHQEAHHIPLPRSPTLHASSHAHRVDKSKVNTARTQHSNQNPLIKRQLEAVEKQYGNSRQSNKVVLSNEAWIPNEIRMKNMKRDISVANETLLVIQKREMSMAREMRRLMVTDLARAQTEESLDATHKMPCECCMQEFLYVNLPLKVSRKAIVDIRTKWSGKLSSATVFGGSEPGAEEEGNGGGDSHEGSPSKTKTKEQRAMERKKQLLSSVPACYDQVGVCVFCAQFFQVQEEYRPSFAAITQTEKRAAIKEARRREREYWDPLKMVEKDRQEQEIRDKELRELQLMAGTGESSLDDGRMSSK